MSVHNEKTINMYNFGGAKEYIENEIISPEIEKWEIVLIMIKIRK